MSAFDSVSGCSGPVATPVSGWALHRGLSRTSGFAGARHCTMMSLITTRSRKVDAHSIVRRHRQRSVEHLFTHTRKARPSRSSSKRRFSLRTRHLNRRLGGSARYQSQSGRFTANSRFRPASSRPGRQGKVITSSRCTQQFGSLLLPTAVAVLPSHQLSYRGLTWH